MLNFKSINKELPRLNTPCWIFEKDSTEQYLLVLIQDVTGQYEWRYEDGGFALDFTNDERLYWVSDMEVVAHMIQQFQEIVK